jgi:hypothetical protein
MIHCLRKDFFEMSVIYKLFNLLKVIFIYYLELKK